MIGFFHKYIGRPARVLEARLKGETMDYARMDYIRTELGAQREREYQLREDHDVIEPKNYRESVLELMYAKMTDREKLEFATADFEESEEIIQNWSAMLDAIIERKK